MTIIKLSCIFFIVTFLLWRFIRILYRFLERKAQQIEERQENTKIQLRELRKDAFENRYDEIYCNDSPQFNSKQRKKSTKSSTHLDDNPDYISSILAASTFHSHHDNLSSNCGDSSSNDSGNSSCD
ncbi:hypothetical protein CN995_01640 [Bacillus cereus]|uniref:hypothetical protein n=1 Tax=Bacillus cereus group TaxID=86661 RepID=UPI000BEB8654|nr:MULTISPECIES: hypothetical protein [Bacillus cereus group]PEE94732.1 hypothetical protein COM92_10795 [Bacillus cereus]PGM04047.1 hypothetical protein CN942_19720 [Bacillus thuringiensis]PGN67463.1 hypothetical protein CN967_30655 [Bacillus cereus]PGP09295.1 hypothetical protein CN995_01640 [Bacillus cereus]